MISFTTIPACLLPQCNAQALSQPSVLPSAGCDELYPKEGEEEGQESQDPAANMGQENILGGEEALYIAATLDQEEKVYIGGDEKVCIIACCTIANVYTCMGAATVCA